MTYTSLIRELEQRGQFRIQPGLQRMRRVMRGLGNPHHTLKYVHIAGTNGKGSVAATVESVMRASGYRTGLYISPHLCDFRERIQINRKCISTQAFVGVGNRILKVEKETDCKLTYFEFVTAAAFCFFAVSALDIVILETGLGGRWDATNLIAASEVSVITSIGLDHTQWLGFSEDQIAREKAGIIKKNGVVICGVRNLGRDVIEKYAHKQHARLYQIQRDFKVKIRHVSWRNGTQSIDWQYGKENTYGIGFSLLGPHQVDNAGIALMALHVLKQRGWQMSRKNILQGLASVQWPGRFHLFRLPHQRFLIVDGAHNPPAISSFLQTFRLSPLEKFKLTLIIGIYKDKDYADIIKQLSRVTYRAIVCPLGNNRSLAPGLLQQEFKQYLAAHNVLRAASITQALKMALDLCHEKEVIVAIGSLTLAGYILKLQGRTDGYHNDKVNFLPSTAPYFMHSYEYSHAG